MSAYRKTGERDIWRGTAGSAIEKGDIVQMVEGTGTRSFDNAATNTPVLGVVDAAVGSAAEGLVDMAHPGDQFWMEITAGTMSEASVGTMGDLQAENGITLTESNNDFLILGWDGARTNWCYGVFTHLDNTVGT